MTEFAIKGCLDMLPEALYYFAQLLHRIDLAMRSERLYVHNRENLIFHLFDRVYFLMKGTRNMIRAQF